MAMVPACWRSHQQSRLTMAPQAPLLLGQRHPLSGRRRRPRAGRCGPGAWFRQPAAAPTHTLKGHILNPKAVPTTISFPSPMSLILWPLTTPRGSMPRHLTRSLRSSKNWMQQQADEHRCEHLARLQAEQSRLPLRRSRFGSTAAAGRTGGSRANTRLRIPSHVDLSNEYRKAKNLLY